LGVPGMLRACGGGGEPESSCQPIGMPVPFICSWEGFRLTRGGEFLERVDREAGDIGSAERLLPPKVWWVISGGLCVPV
jgi:hypothetical protein